MAPLFSVIVPIYKVENYLKQCVDSILNQEYSNYELILVDDGSPDRCPQICDEYAQKDQKVKVIHKENGGLVSARKAGCQVAVGDYILNVDGDDWIMDGYFTAIEAVILKHCPDVVCFGYIYEWEKESWKDPLPHQTGFYDKSKIKDKIFPILIESDKGEIFSPTVWSKATKRELYTKSQMMVDNEISIGEDGACTKPIIYMAESLYIMADCLYYYRQNEQSMTKNRKAYCLDAPGLIAKQYENAITADDDDMQMQICRNFVHNIFIAATTQYNRKDSIRVIHADIRRYLEESQAKARIQKCRYSRFYWKGNLAKLCVQYKQYWLMGLYCKLMGTPRVGTR